MEINEMISTLKNEFEVKQESIESLIKMLENAKSYIDDAICYMESAQEKIEEIEDEYGLSL